MPPQPLLPLPSLPSLPPFHSYTLLTSLSSDATLTTPWSTCAATLSPSPLGSLAPTRVQPFRDTPTAHVLTAPQGQGMSSNTEPTATSVHCWGRGKGGAGGERGRGLQCAQLSWQGQPALTADSLLLSHSNTAVATPRTDDILSPDPLPLPRPPGVGDRSASGNLTQ